MVRPTRIAAAQANVTEARFQQRVEQLARFYGWTPYHTFDSRRSAKGFLDLSLYRHAGDRGDSLLNDLGRAQRTLPGGHGLMHCEIIFSELKVGKRKLTPEQAGWLTAFHAAGMEAYEWRYPDDVSLICERLARGRHRVDPEWALPYTEASA